MAELRTNFVSNVSIGNAPLEVSFQNTSSGPFTRVEWDFGDGNKSTEINPTHVYRSDGSFTVTLTIFADGVPAAQVKRLITVLSQSSGTDANTDIQQALFTTKRFDPGQVAVRKVTTTGTTFSADAVVSTDGTLQSSGQFTAFLEQESFSGGNTIIYSAIGDVNNFLGRASDITLGVVLSPTGTTAADANDWSDFDGTATSPSIPVLFYKVTAVDTGNTRLTVDRTLPSRSDDGSGFTVGAFFGICGATASYGSEVDTEFSLGIDIGTDSAEKLFFTGMDYETFPTSRYVRGFASYVGYTGASGATFAVIYPEWSGASNANRFYPGSTRLSIPWVLWHENTRSGLELYDFADATQRDEQTSLRFRYLRDGRTTNDTIVGQVFHDKKMILITDPELVAAMMQVNDRSWTLPSLSVKHVQSSTGWVSGATAPTGCSWYWTYRVVERSPSDGSFPTLGLGADYHGYGERQSGLPCQYIQRIDIPSGSTGVGYFSVTIPKFNQATGGTNCVVNDTSHGFVASWVELLAATGATSASGPDMTSWRVMTGAPAEAAWTGKFGTNNTLVVDESSSLRWDLSGETYSWANTNLSGSSALHIGNEPVLFGNLSGNFASDIYKMSTVCVGRNNEFNQTQNQTFVDGSNTDVYITEVGLYNEANDLLMVGKLSKPIKKNEQKFVTIKVELDL